MNDQDPTSNPADGSVQAEEPAPGQAAVADDEAMAGSGPAAPGSDMLAQARKLRQNRSTADIILDDRAPGQSRKAIIYLAGAAICLLVLAYLFLAPGPRRTLEDRADAIARRGSAGSSTLQAAVPENEYRPPSPASAQPTEGPFAIGPAPVPAAAPAPASAPPVKPAPSPRASAPAPAAIARPAPITPPPRTGAPGSQSPEKQAYQVLMDARPAFQAMVEGTQEEYRYRDHTATRKTETIFVLNFTFQRGTLAEAVNYIWEVNLALRTVRPIGLAATRLDRQMPRIQDGTGR